MTIGDTVKFTPAYTDGCREGFADVLSYPKTGTVVQISAARGWYRVEFEIAPGVIGHECFRICEKPRETKR